MNLKQLLEVRGLTAYALAKQSELPEQTVRDLVNGKTSFRKIKIETAYKLSKTLEVSLEELYEGETLKEHMKMKNAELNKELTQLMKTLKKYYVKRLDYRRHSNTIQIYYSYEDNKFIEVEQAGNGKEIFKGYEHIYNIPLSKLVLDEGQTYTEYKEYFTDLFATITDEIAAIIEE